MFGKCGWDMAHGASLWLLYEREQRVADSRTRVRSGQVGMEKADFHGFSCKT
jgi:hypothetical protein